MKSKPILLIVITLLIGFVIGMLTSAQIRHTKLKPVKVYFSEQRFRDGFYHAIEPDDQQKEKIDEILDKYASINGDFQDKFRKNLDSTMKEFRKELDQILTKEQQARLKEMDDRRKEMIRENKRNYQHRDSAENQGTGRRDRMKSEDGK
jgi:ElaB/YqjD/DUF883 family membrane-anchored ribosome-binding protein